jgi:uncharacterized protein YdeI (YjbR/CyaY-like superfamily)
VQIHLSGLPILGFDDGSAFEAWISTQPPNAPGTWVKLAKAGAGVVGISRRDAVDAALCHGWIDGQAAKYDAAYFLTRFTPRRARSIWSEVNRRRVQDLIAQGRVTAAGLAQVEAAKADGRWRAAYAPPSTATVPEDLRRALDAHPDAARAFETLPRSSRWTIIYGLATVKRIETRQRKIAATVAALLRGETPAR